MAWMGRARAAGASAGDDACAVVRIGDELPSHSPRQHAASELNDVAPGPKSSPGACIVQLGAPYRANSDRSHDLPSPPPLHGCALPAQLLPHLAMQPWVGVLFSPDLLCYTFAYCASIAASRTAKKRTAGNPTS